MTAEWSGFLRLLDLLAAAARDRHARSVAYTTIYLVGAASHVIECTLTRRTEDLDILCSSETVRATIERPALHVDQLPLSEVITPGWELRASFRPDLSTDELRVWMQDVHDRLLHKLARGEKRDFEDFVEVALTDRRFSAETLWSRGKALQGLGGDVRRMALRQNMPKAFRMLAARGGRVPALAVGE